LFENKSSIQRPFQKGDMQSDLNTGDIGEVSHEFFLKIALDLSFLRLHKYIIRGMYGEPLTTSY
jgi:hypothetical protein